MLNAISILKPVRLIATLIVLLGWFSGSAQEFAVKATLDTNRALIGDQLKLSLSVEKPAGLEVAFPGLKDTLSGKIEIVGVSKTDTTRLASGRMRLDRTLMITVFDTGSFKIPALDFLVQDAVQKDTFTTQPIYFEIIPVKSDSTIRDIKENYKAPVNLAEVMYYIGQHYPYGLILLGTAILVWFLVWYFRKKKNQGKPFLAETTPELPEVVAIRELERLRADKPWLHGHIKQYHIRISEILRWYIERHYRFMALEQTTDEILRGLGTSKLTPVVISNLAGILRLNDLVKFAKVIPDEQENARQVDLAIDFVRESVASEAAAVTADDAGNALVQTNAASDA